MLSVRPRYAEMLLSGEKTVELRRVRPRIGPGDFILLYASSPQCRVVGVCRVVRILAGAPGALWGEIGQLAAVSRPEYNRYFKDARRAIAIVVERPLRMSGELTLRDLRKHAPGFRPPRSFGYLANLERRLQVRLTAAMQEVAPCLDQRCCTQPRVRNGRELL